MKPIVSILRWAGLLSEPDGWNIDIRPFHPLAVVLLLLPLFLLRRRGKSAGYLLCFSLFFLYFWAVASFAVCPLPIDEDVLVRLAQGQTWHERINLAPRLLPRVFELWYDVEVLGNVLMGVPFGFGVPFVLTPGRVKLRRALGLCFAFAAGLELVQLGISLVFYGFPYRSIDIEDVVLVFAGTLAGHAAVLGAAHLYRRLGWARGGRLPVWDHFHAVLLGLSGASPPSGKHRSPGAPEEAAEARGGEAAP